MIKNFKYYICRVLSFQIDMIILACIALPIAVGITLLCIKLGGHYLFDEKTRIGNIFMWLLTQSVGWGSHIFYMLIIQSKYSTTIGKRLFGLKVLKTDGSNLDIRTTTIRYFSFLLSVATFGIGLLLILFDRKNQALHDKIAKTHVVFDR